MACVVGRNDDRGAEGTELRDATGVKEVWSKEQRRRKVEKSGGSRFVINMFLYRKLVVEPKQWRSQEVEVEGQKSPPLSSPLLPYPPSPYLPSPPLFSPTDISDS